MFFYLFFEIWLWLLIAFVLGWVAHWLLCCRGGARDENGTTDLQNTELENNSSIESPSEAIEAHWQPQGLEERPSQIDDLKRIKGIGAVIENTLNELGVYQFSQLASWSDDNVQWVEHHLAFPGRITREEWIKQAKTLDEGGTTEFAERVDSGSVDYKS